MERTRLVASLSQTGALRSRALRWLPLAALTIDLATVSASGVAAYLGRSHSTYFDHGFSGQSTLGWPAALMIIGWLASIALVGGYDKAIFGSGTEEFKRVARAISLTAALVGIGCYLTKYDLSRGFFLIGLLAGFPLVLGGRALLRLVTHAVRRRGMLLVRVVVAGTPDHIDEVAAVLRNKPWLGYSVVGALTPAQDGDEETPAGVPILGPIDDLVTTCKAASADLIFFAGGSVATGQELKEHVWRLEEQDINVVIAPSLTDVSGERVNVRPIGGLPLIHLDHPTWANAGRFAKRAFDVIGSSFIILMLAPVFAVAAAQIWLFDKGPLLYRQQRVGRRGEYFDCLKFRTMVVNAEAMVAQLQEQTQQSALLFKMKDDPRITKPGRWLRRYSIDELPQLFNVLRGDMSLVGPRPQVQKEVDLYENGMERRLLVRPGMTGLWQVSGRNDLSPAEAQRLDLFYVDNWSMLQDLSIMFRTFGAVLGSRGAY